MTRANPAYVDALYQRYLDDPKSVDEAWALFFAGFDLAAGNHRRTLPATAAAQIAEVLGGAGAPPMAAAVGLPADRPAGIFDLVHSFRELGHYVAKLDPLGNNPERHPLLAEAEARFAEQDLDRLIRGVMAFKGAEDVTIRELIRRLRAT